MTGPEVFVGQLGQGCFKEVKIVGIEFGRLGCIDDGERESRSDRTYALWSKKIKCSASCIGPSQRLLGPAGKRRVPDTGDRPVILREVPRRLPIVSAMTMTGMTSKLSRLLVALG